VADAVGRVVLGRRALAGLETSLAGPCHFRRYWRDVVDGGPQRLASNLDVAAGLVVTQNGAWPLTVSSRAVGNAYACSLHTHYVEYPRAEARQLRSRLERALATGAFAALDPLLRAAGIDRHVQWSSWLLSTNLHPRGVCEAVGPVTRILAERFPDHAIALRCVDPRTHPHLTDALRDEGYALVAARQIWYFDGAQASFAHRSDVKRDSKLLAAMQEYTCCDVGELSTDDLERMTQLYRSVYLDRHTHFNTAYGEQFLRLGVSAGWLRAKALRHSSGRIDGVFARFDGECSVSVPFIGYDTRLPVDLGLYRALFAALLRDVAAEGALLNYSSGAGDFKRRRGGEMTVEYNAIYARHLSHGRRAALLGLCRVIDSAAGKLFATRVL